MTREKQSAAGTVAGNRQQAPTLIGQIKDLLRTINVNKLSLVEVEQPSMALWWDNKGQSHETMVLAVGIDDKGNPEEVQTDIGMRYREHLASEKSEPRFAYCQIVRTDNYDGCEGQYIRLDGGPVDENDDRLIASCNGIKELKAMAVPSGDRNFTLVECQGLYPQRT